MNSPDVDGDSNESELPDDVVADLLSSERRRLALETLALRDEAMVIDDLAAVVRAKELNTSADAVEEDDRKDVRDEFFQRHLPKLTATDVVRYNSMLGTVELVRETEIEHGLDEH